MHSPKADEEVAAHLARALVYSHDLITRRGVRALLRDCARDAVVVETTTLPEAIGLTPRLRPDIVVLDGSRSTHLVLTVLPRLTAITKVLVLLPNEHVTGPAHRTGAHTLLRADVCRAGFVGAVHEVLSTGRTPLSPGLPAVDPSRAAATQPQTHGRSREADVIEFPVSGTHDVRRYLSRREVDVMDQVARGLCNSDIAMLLGIREKTVKNHINQIYAKLQVATRAQAILQWLGVGHQIAE
ncbi:DNA-binding response regulator [Streptomyces sp. NBC_01092]|uniref:response regulator transcription factor n=1 Tax=Streptomyces sp. NBC_01092 TaxID=2903748 RepID=UPI00386D1B62|nr:response regulator transcription factor [Streptomyces sp. NBC_01092]